MNQEEYDAIAEIIKIEKDSWESQYVKCSLINISVKLANYFEKEEIPSVSETERFQKNRFDREQFLKDCGVRE